tara:strand:- start:488 stop:769 length:282 start_codon:yes stop_codon:yes gene_type:complete
MARHDETPDTITVAQYRFRFEAEHALEFLRQNGVDAILWGDDVGGLNPAIGFVEAFGIRVRADQETLARELLHDFGLARPGSSEPEPDPEHEE